MNTAPKDFKNMLNVFSSMKEKIPFLKDTFQQYAKRISDYDSIGGEVVQVLLTNHLINMVTKYRSEIVEDRLDAFNSAMLLAIVHN
jgi:hypothetical protein